MEGKNMKLEEVNRKTKEAMSFVERWMKISAAGLDTNLPTESL
jgi:hypothetical protein